MICRSMPTIMATPVLVVADGPCDAAVWRRVASCCSFLKTERVGKCKKEEKAHDRLQH